MDTKLVALAVFGICIAIPLTAPYHAQADDGKIARANGENLILIPNGLNQPLDIAPFIAKSNNKTKPSLTVEKSSTHNSKAMQYNSSSNEDGDLEDKILALIPHSDKMKRVWSIADGDVDLHFEGLRFDRKNMGVKYTTSTLPMIGEMTGIEFEFEAGDDNNLSFESDIMPLVGHIDGFTFKGSAGDDNRISARYTMNFD